MPCIHTHTHHYHSRTISASTSSSMVKDATISWKGVLETTSQESWNLLSCHKGPIEHVQRKKKKVHTIPQKLDTRPEMSTPNRFEGWKLIYQGGKKKFHKHSQKQSSLSVQKNVHLKSPLVLISVMEFVPKSQMFYTCCLAKG